MSSQQSCMLDMLMHDNQGHLSSDLPRVWLYGITAHWTLCKDLLEMKT